MAQQDKSSRGRQFHDEDPPEISAAERRLGPRRILPGRRAGDGMDEDHGGYECAETVRCALHDVELRMRDERCAERKTLHEQNWATQRAVNTRNEELISRIDRKLNYILGAACVALPIMQIIIQLMFKGGGK